MRKNLPVFPHRRVGFADAAALIPAVGIVRMSLLATSAAKQNVRDGRSKSGLIATILGILDHSAAVDYDVLAGDEVVFDKGHHGLRHVVGRRDRPQRGAFGR